MVSFIRQAGAIPFKFDAGALRVLLITTRGTGKWVIPKGWIEPGASAAQAAAQEAYEEAGITGLIGEAPLGTFTYRKRLGSGARKPAVVEVFALQVEKQRKNWPERGERRFKWVDIQAACSLIEYPGMPPLFQTLAELHGHCQDGGTLFEAAGLGQERPGLCPGPAGA
jgi:8-oxo-dGTP pyrophosphatase MutT (NUDIX family)